MQALAALAILVAAIAQPAAAARVGELPPPNLRVSFSRHGSDWTQGNCASRNEQSPVNLNELYKPVDFSFSYFYANVHSQNITLRNDGRTISIDVTGQGFGGVALPHSTAPWYSLKRIDLHASSEHTLRGKHAPVEVQLVHQASTISDATAGQQLVTVSILVDCESPPTAQPVWPGLLQKRSRSGGGVRGRRGAGAEGQQPEQAAAYSAPSADDPDFNPTFQVFVERQPPIFDEDESVSLSPSDPWQLGHLLAGGTYFMYKGSETLPPCEERVVWLVRRERIMASNAQVRALFERLYTTSRGAGNYRTIMPMNQRIVRVWSAREQEPPAIPLRPPFAQTVPQSSHDHVRESPAITLAKDAMTIANAAADHAKDLALRLAAAEEARLGVEAPSIKEEVANEVKREVQEAVAETVHQVVPAAANLAKSYLRQEILHAAGLPRPPVGGPLPLPAGARPPSPAASATSPAPGAPPSSPAAPVGPGPPPLAPAPSAAPARTGIGGR